MARTTYEQRTWLVAVFLFMVCLHLWKIAHSAYPSAWLALMGTAIFAATVYFCVKLIASAPKFQSMMAWAIPAFIGEFLNLSVRLANGGYMPAYGEQFVRGSYCPMAGANLACLGDWVCGFISPGDILMAVGFLGIIATILLRRRKNTLMEQA